MATLKTFSGSSFNDLYENDDPYSFPNVPLAPSKTHAVLFELPITLTTPPIPHRNSQTYWDNNHVKLPYSPKNVFPVENEHGEKILKSRWEIIENSLLRPIKSSRDLEAAINCYNTRLPPFGALHHLFEEVLDEDEANQFFDNLLPGIIQLALQLPEILPGNLPLLRKETSSSISLSQLQIASLLANGFLCTFPWNKDISSTYPGLNFSRLFAAHSRPKRVNCVTEKIKAICNYFRRVISKAPVGTVTFEHKYLRRNQFPRWDKVENNLGNTKVHITSSGTIEDGHGFLQVDFANKFVGGGVLGYGCVQEEIRFIICPELIVSRLFTEELDPGEALVITGAERYNNHSGYGDTFILEGDYCDKTPHDCYGRRKTTIVAIDAVKFNKPSDQFHTSLILRELNKAYVGFHSTLSNKLAPVATGNWGCGAFKGDARLKSLLQLMACSASKRNMIYYTFGDVDLEKTIYNLYTFLASKKVTISEVWRLLCRFVASNSGHTDFIPYIQQAYFDLHNQPTITQFYPKSMDVHTKPSREKIHEIQADTPTPSTSSVEVRNEKFVDKKNDKCLKENDKGKIDDNLFDIIKLFSDAEDVNEVKKDECAEESMLASIDNYSRQENIALNRKDDCCIEIESNEKLGDSLKPGSKRKITDYFGAMRK